MYAIVKTGGKQYRVEQGQRLLVERLATKEGDDVRLEPVLYRSDDVVFDSAALKDVIVTARVLAHVRGEKLRVFKFKPKRGYRRRTGHRQDLTQIEVTEIARGRARGAAKAAAAKAPADRAAEASRAESAAAKPAAKAPTAKPGAKAPAAKPPAAKRGAAKPAAAKPAGEKARDARAAGAKPVRKAKEKPKDGS
jgi:large subunit ribosomal protein L21